MKRKSKIFSLFFIFLLTFCITFSLFPSVDAYTNITLTTWEEFNLGLTEGIGSKISFKRITGDNEFIISNAWNNSPIRSLYAYCYTGAGISERGFINLTNSYDYINSFSMSFYQRSQSVTNWAGSHNIYLKFYNSTNILVLELAFLYTYSTIADGLYYKDSAGIYQIIKNLDSTNPRDETTIGIISFTHISGNLMSYSLIGKKGATWVNATIEGSSVTTANWNTFSYIKMDYGYNSGGTWSIARYLYLDDIIITTGISPYENIPSCDENSIGKLNIDTYVWTTKRYVLFTYNNIIDGYLTSFKVLLHKKMIDMGATTNNMFLWCNFENLSTPDSLIQINSEYYVAIWENVINIQHSDVTFVLETNKYFTYGNTNYYWTIGETSDDIDNDGDTIFIWYPLNPFITSSSGIVQNGYDVIYETCFYQESIDNPYLTNYINVYPSTVEVLTPIYIYGTISSEGIGYENRLIVNKSTTEYINKTIYGQYFNDVFTPIISGTYRANLIQNDVIVTYKDVIITDSINWSKPFIYTNPSKTKTGEMFNIYYNYPYTTYDGLIEAYLYGSTIPSFSMNINKQSNSNDTNIQISFTKSGLYTFYLKIDKISNTSIIASNIHIVSDGIGLEFYPSKYNVLSNEVFTIYCQHDYLGLPIFIMDNNDILFNVGNNQYGTYPTSIHETTTRIHNISLIINDGKTKTVLSFFKLTVTVTKPSDKIGFSLDFGQPYNTFIAIFIIMLLVITPLAFNTLLARNTSLGKIEIPALVYVGMFLFGVGINVAVGWLEPWVLFFVLFGLILAFAILWIQKKGDVTG